MKVLLKLCVLISFVSCSSAPKDKIQPKDSPFSALLTKDAEREWRLINPGGSKFITNDEFKNYMLQDYSASDRHDGDLDGNAHIKTTCVSDESICQHFNHDKDEHLDIDEYLQKLDEIFITSDKDNDCHMSQEEFTNLLKGSK